MRIGVVGDTHDRMTNVERIVELFDEARVERIVHTGDITQPAVLEHFARLGVPLLGVFGNNDASGRSALVETASEFGMDFIDPPRTVEWAGRRILIAHDPEEVPAIHEERHAIDLVLHGHTHRHRHEHIGATLFFNPGECAGFLPGYNAVGLIDLIPLEAERLHF